MGTRPWRAILAFLSSAVVLFAAMACAGADDEQAPARQPATPAVALAADQTFRVNLGGEPDTLDPSRASFAVELSVIESLFRGPFKYDGQLKLVPDMAVEIPTKTNGGISEDGLTYTITLKPGLKWSNGAAITSHDLAFALRRAANPATGGSYASLLWEIKGGEKLAGLKPTDAALDEAVKGLAVEATDEQTVKVTLGAPNAVFVNYLALWIAYPLPEQVIAAKGKAWIEAGNLVSSGPFVLKEWQHKDHITLVPNPNYFGEKPAATIRYAMITDANQALNAYRAGELDQVAIPSAVVPAVNADPELGKQVVTLDRLRTFRVIMVNSKAPLDNKKVRQALAYAVDRNALVDIALKGVGKPAASLIPPGMAGHDPNLGPGFDQRKAKQLLAEAGYPGGEGLPKVVLTYVTAGSGPAIAPFLKEQWKHYLGVDVDLDPIEPKAFQERFKSGAMQATIASWGADYADPENFLRSLAKTGAGTNMSGYSNRAVDDLLAQAQLEVDRVKSVATYVEIQKLLHEDSPEVYLFYDQASVLRRPTVAGVAITGMDHQVLGDRSLEYVKILAK